MYLKCALKRRRGMKGGTGRDRKEEREGRKEGRIEGRVEGRRVRICPLSTTCIYGNITMC